ncbi:MAG: hypothetical protein KDM63_17260, partial [Verrucomicrobiae bacterium]|nr:hypothetical protein [Verrucomicrobiae bacterium]
GLNGDISINSGGEVAFVAGTGRLDEDGDIRSNEDFRIYAMLGHGGWNADPSNNDSTTPNFFVRTAPTIAGTEGAGEGNWGHFGDITVIADGGVNILAGDSSRTDPMLRSFGAGAGTYHWAQLGHCGYHTFGDHHGNITVRAGMASDGTVTNANADVYLAAGGTSNSEWADQRTFAHLGHGGLNASAGELGRDGEVLTVMAGRDVTAQAGVGVGNYVHIGNGGTILDRNTGNSASPVGVDIHTQDIVVMAGRDVNLLASDFDPNPAPGFGMPNRYVFASATDTNRSLDMAANLGGGADFTFQFNRIVDGTIRFIIRDDNGAIIGNLAQSGTDIVVSDPAGFSADMNGNGSIEASEVFNFGDVVATYNGSSSITFSRDVNPGADDGAANIEVLFETAQADRAYAMLGHGGYDAEHVNGTAADPFATANISVEVGRNILIQGGTDDDNFAQLGHGGRSTRGGNTGDIEIDAGGKLELIGGTTARAYASVGHGGYDADGDQAGNICIHVGENVLLDATQGNGQLTYTMIGNGGYSAQGNHNGYITVVSGLSGANGGISLLGGPSGGSDLQFAQIGHGGASSSSMSLSGDITLIDRGGGGLSLTGGSAANSYALVGHGDGIVNTSGSRVG